MFTVMIRSPKGDERLREDAQEVRRSPDGVTIRWSDGIETHFGPAPSSSQQHHIYDPSSDQQHHIYVMNRHGATVATYHV